VVFVHDMKSSFIWLLLLQGNDSIPREIPDPNGKEGSVKEANIKCVNPFYVDIV